jgi:diacylglycerol kinase family enzyme
MYMEDVKTTMLMGFNSKFGGGGMILNPIAIMNDGYADMMLIPGKYGFGKMVGMLD